MRLGPSFVTELGKLPATVAFPLVFQARVHLNRGRQHRQPLVAGQSQHILQILRLTKGQHISITEPRIRAQHNLDGASDSGSRLKQQSLRVG
jgi:hypothetical protein